MTKSHIIVLAATAASFLVAACTSSTTVDPTADVLPAVPRSTRISSLAREQWGEFCAWRFEMAGGAAGHPCAVGGVLQYDIDGCERDYDTYGPDSPGYLGAALSCVVEFVKACDTTGVLTVPPICAEASSVPLGSTP